LRLFRQTPPWSGPEEPVTGSRTPVAGAGPGRRSRSPEPGPVADVLISGGRGGNSPRCAARRA